MARLSSIIERFLGFFKPKPKKAAEQVTQKKSQAETLIKEEFRQEPVDLSIILERSSEKSKQKPLQQFKKAPEQEFEQPLKARKKPRTTIKARARIIKPKIKPGKKFFKKAKQKKKKPKKAKPMPVVRFKRKPKPSKQLRLPAKIVRIESKQEKIFPQPKTFEPEITQEIEEAKQPEPKQAIPKQFFPKPLKAKKEKAKEKPLRIVAERVEILPPKEKKQAEAIEYPSIELKEGELNIEEQIDFVKEKIKHLKTQFYKRGIDEDEFKKKMFDYNEELHLLESEKSKGKKAINAAMLGKIAPEKSFKNKVEKERIIERIIERAPSQSRRMPSPEIVEKGGIITFGGKEDEEPRIERHIEPEIITLGEGIEKEKDFPSLRQTIERKIAGKVDNERLKSIESKIDQLMRQYNISEKEIKSEVERLDAGQIVKDFDKLVNLIELEHKASKLSEPVSYNPFDQREQQKIKKEEAKTVIKEIQKHRIVTDLDRILGFVKENRTATVKDLSTKLNMDRKRIAENAEILEKHGLVRLEYPPIGEMRVYDAAYSKPTFLEKKKKKQLGELVKQAKQKPK